MIRIGVVGCGHLGGIHIKLLNASKNFDLLGFLDNDDKIHFDSFGINGFIIAALWECAENHNKLKQSKKQRTVWGVLTQIYCGLGVLGLIFTAYDLIKTL